MYLEADRKIYHTTDFFDNDKERHNFPKTKVLYFGTGLPLQGTDVVMEAFLKLSAGKDFYCTYVGSTKRISKSLLKNAAESDNIRIIDWLNQEELSKEIGKSDVCLAGHFNPDIDKADRTIPGKALIYEAMGKTMILGDTKANHEIFKEDSKHFFVKRGDADALARSVADICEINGQKT